MGAGGLSVAIVTPTYERPEALALCERWVKHQDYPGSIDWIVTSGPSIPENLAHALRQVDQDMVFVFEDDDYYAPSWISFGVERLRRTMIIAQEHRYSYHLPTGLYDDQGQGLAPACMAFRREMVAGAIGICERGEMLKRMKPLSRRRVEMHDGRRVVALKGMPGTPNKSITQMMRTLVKTDPDRSVLRRWLGADAEPYLEIIRREGW